jgi:hypothetical protein
MLLLFLVKIFMCRPISANFKWFLTNYRKEENVVVVSVLGMKGNFESVIF